MATSVHDLGEAEAPPDQRRRHRGARVLLAALITLLLIEGGARALDRQLPEAAEWNHVVTDGHSRNVEELADAGGVDVLAVGSSVAAAGIDPQMLAEEVGAPRGAYNLWMVGPSMRSIELLTLRYALPALAPRTLVIAVSSRELNDEGQSQAFQFETLRSSAAARQLLPDESALGRLERAAGDVSTLVRSRQALRQTGRVLNALRGIDDDEEIDALGMDTSRLERELEIVDAHVEQERGALRPFAVGGAELDALERLTHGARSRGVDVVLVDMPVVEDVYPLLHEDGRVDDVRYQAVLRAFAEDNDVDLVRARDLDWEDRLFADENHLNGAGAERLTSIVGQALR